MYSIGNDEIDALPPIDMFEELPCRECGKMLIPYDSTPPTLIYIDCHICTRTWLVGIRGKKLEWEE